MRGDWERVRLHKHNKQAKLSRTDSSNDRNVFIPKSERAESPSTTQLQESRVSFGRPMNKIAPLWLDCLLQSHHNFSEGFHETQNICIRLNIKARLYRCFFFFFYCHPVFVFSIKVRPHLKH